MGAAALAALLGFGALATGAEDRVPVPVSFDEWQQKLDGWQGDIVVVDMWATWCSSCLVRFPKMVELHDAYASKGVRFVSLCLDDRDDAEALAFAARFLEKQRAPFEHYLMNEKLMVAFEKLDLLGIPAVVIYRRDGEEAARLTGDNPNDQFDDRDIEEAVKTLL